MGSLMANLLGKGIWARRPKVGLWIGAGCAVPRRTRSAQRHHERRAWQRNDQEPYLYFNPRFQREDDYDADPSDCRHGCNGDCITSGSERCTLTCHERAK